MILKLMWLSVTNKIQVFLSLQISRVRCLASLFFERRYKGAQVDSSMWLKLRKSILEFWRSLLEEDL